MSEDQEPARSRRALRRAREAQGEQPDTGGSAETPPSPTPPAEPRTSEPRRSEPGKSEPRRSDAGRSAGTASRVPQSGAGTSGDSAAKNEPAAGSRRRRAADTPVDAPLDRPSERSSQARARNRETLRTYKALSEQDTKRAEQAPLTRRQLRQQQLDAERRAAGADPGAPSAVAPAAPQPAQAAPATRPAQRGRGPQRRSAAARAAEVSANEAATETPLTDDALNDMSVEQALAARAALVEQAKNQLSMLDASKQEDPLAVDLEVLAEQKKLAERAAVLNQRAMAKQRLSEESQRHKPVRNDPASTHNLAMVTPLEFVRVPGFDQPVMQAPVTSHIPVITSTTQRVPAVGARPKPVPPRQPAVVRQAQVAPVTKHDSTLPPSVLSGDDPRNASGSRSHVLAHAEAVASTRVSAPPMSSRSLPRVERPEPTDEGGPISAHTAHGLEPLDSMTAGLARSKRAQLLQMLIVLFGSIALVVGLILIFGG